MTDDRRMAIIEQHVNALAEHFDCVQILCASLREDGRTVSFKKGSGLWHARRGLAQEFIEEDRSEDAAIRIARHLDPPDPNPFTNPF